MYSTTSSITCNLLYYFTNSTVYTTTATGTCTVCCVHYSTAAHVPHVLVRVYICTRITITYQYTYCTRYCTVAVQLYMYLCTSIENQYCCVRMHEHTGTAETYVHEPVLKISTVVFKCTSTVPVLVQLYGTSAHVPVLKISTVVFETTSVVSI